MSVVHKFVPFLEGISNAVAHHAQVAGPSLIHAEVRTPQHAAEQNSAVLCISGFACSSYNFAWLADELSKSHICVLLDNRGMGLSSKAQGDYELSDLADDAVRMMESLGFQSYHVIGISMGGMIAQLIAIRHSNKVKSLSLLCSSSGGSDFPKLPEITISALEQFYSIPEPKRSAIGLMAYTHSYTREKKAELFQAMVELRSSHPAHLDQALKQKAAVDRFLAKDSPLNLIQCPTLILVAAEDRFVPKASADIFKQKIAGSEVQVLEECDHFFFLEKSTETARILTSFICKSKSQKSSQSLSQKATQEAHENH